MCLSVCLSVFLSVVCHALIATVPLFVGLLIRPASSVCTYTATAAYIACLVQLFFTLQTGGFVAAASVLAKLRVFLHHFALTSTGAQLYCVDLRLFPCINAASTLEVLWIVIVMHRPGATSSAAF